MHDEAMTPGAVARLIDHTNLRPDAVLGDIERLCQEARTHGFATVCVAPAWLDLAVSRLLGCVTVACTVIGFPLGYATTAAKVCEATGAVESGARELDMVIHVGALKSGDDRRVRSDIAAVTDVARATGVVVKVILETALLDDGEKRRACELAVEAGAAFVKTSTGFGPGGATAADVTLMRAVVGDSVGVKASGGIRDLATVIEMLAAGANRIGTSSSLAIMAELSRTKPTS